MTKQEHYKTIKAALELLESHCLPMYKQAGTTGLTSLEEMRADLATAEAMAYTLGHPRKSPFCEHSSQWAYTDDGGKSIRCLLCSESALRKDGEDSRRKIRAFDQMTESPNPTVSGWAHRFMEAEKSEELILRFAVVGDAPCPAETKVQLEGRSDAPVRTKDYLLGLRTRLRDVGYAREYLRAAIDDSDEVLLLAAQDVAESHSSDTPVPPEQQGAGVSPFQNRVDEWLLACFGEEIARDKVERNHRFLEESLELVQALGCTAGEAHQLVDYTFGRPAGESSQECGGVMVTLAALCIANELWMEGCAETELTRIHSKIEQIRAKQATKPKHSPLPAEQQGARTAAMEPQLSSAPVSSKCPQGARPNPSPGMNQAATASECPNCANAPHTGPCSRKLGATASECPCRKALEPFAAMDRPEGDLSEAACIRGVASDMTMITSRNWRDAAKVFESPCPLEAEREEIEAVIAHIDPSLNRAGREVHTWLEGLLKFFISLDAERGEAIRTRNLAQEASTRDLEAKRQAEDTLKGATMLLNSKLREDLQLHADLEAANQRAKKAEAAHAETQARAERYWQAGLKVEADLRKALTALRTIWVAEDWRLAAALLAKHPEGK